MKLTLLVLLTLTTAVFVGCDKEKAAIEATKDATQKTSTSARLTWTPPPRMRKSKRM